MRQWLPAVLAGMSLSEETEGYLFRRGVSDRFLEEIGFLTWEVPEGMPAAPDSAFRKQTGRDGYGSFVRGNLVTPIRSPSGRLIGVEFRSIPGSNEKKRVSQYLLPDAAWNPVLLGLGPDTMRRIWKGGDVWIAEGIFDVAAIVRVIPTSDAAVATLRARMSDQHVHFLKRFCRGTVNMAYDNDSTGRRQTDGWFDTSTGKRRLGALDLLERVGVKCRNVPYRGGKDPGVVWEQHGDDGLRREFGSTI